jgi:hypothetical protein
MDEALDPTKASSPAVEIMGRPQVREKSVRLRRRSQGLREQLARTAEQAAAIQEHAAAIHEAMAEQGGPIGDALEHAEALVGSRPRNEPRRAPTATAADA